MTRTADRGDTIEGVVSARQCDCCGHHEIGIITPDGEFVALRPGLRVIIEKMDPPAEDAALK